MPDGLTKSASNDPLRAPEYKRPIKHPLGSSLRCKGDCDNYRSRMLRYAFPCSHTDPPNETHPIPSPKPQRIHLLEDDTPPSPAWPPPHTLFFSALRPRGALEDPQPSALTIPTLSSASDGTSATASDWRVPLRQACHTPPPELDQGKGTALVHSYVSSLLPETHPPSPRQPTKPKGCTHAPQILCSTGSMPYA